MAYLKHQGSLRSKALYETTRDFLLWAKQRNNQFLPTKWTLNNRMFLRRCEIFGNPKIDLFTTRWNRRLVRFVSPVPDPLAYAVDAISVPWKTGIYGYAFSPISHDSPGTPKIRTDRALVLLICPLMWYKSWISPLLSMLVSAPVNSPSSVHSYDRPTTNDTFRFDCAQPSRSSFIRGP